MRHKSAAQRHFHRHLKMRRAIKFQTERRSENYVKTHTLSRSVSKVWRASVFPLTFVDASNKQISKSDAARLESVCVTGVLRDGIPTEIRTFVKIGFQNES